ncbi:hypothetical protein [Streptomyces triculaminicus]|uniref:hypothetical protein n=1 Tax=Streptomyces triculaminicus TaxID=2816232 RepID=UPI0037D92E9A
MDCYDDQQHADMHLTELLGSRAVEYISDPSHDPEFASVVYGSLVAESQAQYEGLYPPEGHGYPRPEE